MPAGSVRIGRWDDGHPIRMGQGGGYTDHAIDGTADRTSSSPIDAIAMTLHQQRMKLNEIDGKQHAVKANDR
jgi:hypothetical protein